MSHLTVPCKLSNSYVNDSLCCTKHFETSPTLYSDTTDCIGKIQNYSRNVYRSYKIFIVNVYLLLVLAHGMNNHLRCTISVKDGPNEYCGLLTLMICCGCWNTFVIFTRYIYVLNVLYLIINTMVTVVSNYSVNEMSKCFIYS